MGIYDSPTINSRLAFVRYLLQDANDHSELPEPMCFTALLMLHDAVEMTLQLIAGNLGLKIEDGLMKYWRSLRDSHAALEIGFEGAIQRLNKARVNLKHYGIYPSRADLNEFQTTAPTFVESVVKQAFDLDFKTISLSDLVDVAHSREHLRKSEPLMDSDPSEALVEIALAFESYLGDFDARMNYYGFGPFNFGPKLRDVPRLRREQETQQKIFESQNKTIEGLQSVVKLMALGIDYRAYVKYRMCVPRVRATMDGEYHVTRWRQDEPTSASARFAYNFVLTSILKIQKAKFEFEHKGGGQFVLSSHPERPNESPQNWKEVE